MHLSGHYSNPPEALEAALAAFAEARVGGRRRQQAAFVQPPCRLGNGELQSAVIRVLEAAGRPLGIREVRLAVERRLRKPVPESSVNACLSVGARRTGHFQRVSPGCYQLSSEAKRVQVL
jgi:hypothetical protein